MLKSLSAVILALVVIPSLADAKTLYVNRATGNDSTSYAANGPSAPWATIGRAAWGSTNRAAPNAREAAQAGDVVIVAAGRYSVTGTGSRWIPALNPVNSGTSGNPITFQTDGGVVDFQFSSGVGPVIGSDGHDYITWRGFTVDEALCPPQADTGPVVLHVASNCVIEYCNLYSPGYPAGWGGGERHSAISINSTGGGHTIRYNYMHGFVGSSWSDGNGSSIMIDQSAGGLIEHNEMANSSGGVAIKRIYNAPGTWIMRYNYVHDSAGGFRTSEVSTTAPTGYEVNIYQNLLVNISGPAFTGRMETGRNSWDIHVVNNTVVGGMVGWQSNPVVQDASFIFWNNILVDVTDGFWFYDAAVDLRQFDAQHNVYLGWTYAAKFAYDTGGQTNLSFAQWRARGQDQASPAGQVADPQFVDRVGRNYRLQAGSPARNVGVDRLDLNGNGSTTDLIPAGAYITGTEVIGRGVNGGAPRAPSAPTGVAIIR